RLNALIRKIRPAGLAVIGIVHSHPGHFRRPSGGDLVFLQKIFANPKNASHGNFLFPIVADGQFFPYVIDTVDVDHFRSADLMIV
ncbi:MAG: Mov34/MPN/PAD-1 family protein, partial [Planctomycetaceae bacterium]|nr:Mov34/MPN/PAD-1 family protein [Planctomycetaceae bacterium]